MKSSLSFGFASRVTFASLVAWFGIVAACSATPDPGSTNRPGSGSGSGGSSSSFGGSSSSSGGSIGPIDIPDSSAPDARDTKCDDAGNCTCVNVVVYGRLPSYGADPPGSDTTIAFQNYLNSKSSANVSVVTQYTPLTQEFLANYDIIILQALEDREGGPYWQFSASDIANLQAWVEAGGGIMSLTGYGGRVEEVNPTNQLLAFSGLSYGTADIYGTCPDSCCYCAGNSVPVDGWQGSHPISAHMTRVGAFHGRPVMAPADAATVVSGGGSVLGATKQVGQGRVFFFFDEWVTYTSQWGTAIPSGVDRASCIDDPNHMCARRTPDVDYTVPQFWYNTLLWLSGDRECFHIDDPVIVF